jgi:hypothetical protein
MRRRRNLSARVRPRQAFLAGGRPRTRFGTGRGGSSSPLRAAKVSVGGQAVYRLWSISRREIDRTHVLVEPLFPIRPGRVAAGAELRREPRRAYYSVVEPLGPLGFGGSTLLLGDDRDVGVRDLVLTLSRDKLRR